MPRAYLEALARLQDKVEPFAFDEVEKIVSSELGVRMSKAFSEFDVTPMAAASLGQVHRARLRDGRQVAVESAAAREFATPCSKISMPWMKSRSFSINTPPPENATSFARCSTSFARASCVSSITGRRPRTSPPSARI